MSTKSGSFSIACVQLGPQKLSIIQNSGCPLFRSCLSIEVNGRTVGTFRIARYIMGVRFSEVSVKRGSTVLQRKEPIPEVQEVLTEFERSTCLMLCHVEQAI